MKTKSYRDDHCEERSPRRRCEAGEMKGADGAGARKAGANQGLRELFAGVECIGQHEGRAWLRPRQQFREESARHARGRTMHDGEVHLVHHQRFIRQAMMIFRVQAIGEEAL